MPLYFGTDTTGSNQSDIAFLWGNGAFEGLSGNDLILGDMSFFYGGPPPGGNSLETADNLDISNLWYTYENPLVYDDSVPWTSVVVTPDDGEAAEWFSFNASAGATVTIDIDAAIGGLGSDGSSDVFVQVYDSMGNLLFQNDDSDPANGGFGSLTNRDSFLQFTAPSSATYYIKVFPFGGGTFGANVSFVMNLSVTGHAATGTIDVGNDELSGFEGDDQIFGQGGNDTLTGGAGNDLLHGGSGDDIVTLDEGFDTAYGDLGADTFIVGSLSGGFIDGGDGDDVVRFDFTGASEGMAFAFVGGDSSNISINGNSLLLTSVELADSPFLGTEFADWIDLSGAPYSSTQAFPQIYGQGGDDVILGSSNQPEDLHGDEGNDTLVSDNNSDDWLYGGEGDDFLYGGATQNLFDGGDGIDTAVYLQASIGVSVDLLASGAETGQGEDLFAGIENLFGSAYSDRLFGDDLANRLDGDGGDDRLVGRGGDDVLGGDLGNDRMYGGLGADRLNGGGDNDRLYGDEGNDRLIGADGDDRLIGGLGNDEMFGGTGDDIYFVDDIGDTVSENASQGTDRVVAGIDYTLQANFEVLRMRTGDLDGTGNNLDNLLRGVGGSNILRGLSGNDDIYGGTGNDFLYGGGGSDRLYGEVGTDQMTGGSGLDYYIFQSAEELGDRVAVADRITDFSQADGDRMNVRGIDANTNSGGDQNFAFIGTGAFTGTAGQLRYFQTSTSTVVEMDVDGDGTGDLYIRLDGQIDLTAGDFVL